MSIVKHLFSSESHSKRYDNQNWPRREHAGLLLTEKICQNHYTTVHGLLEMWKFYFLSFPLHKYNTIHDTTLTRFYAFCADYYCGDGGDERRTIGCCDYCAGSGGFATRWSPKSARLSASRPAKFSSKRRKAAGWRMRSPDKTRWGKSSHSLA